MNRIAGRESEIKRSLYLFISHYIPCANLHLIDNIVLSYIASILEEAANYSSFGISDFMEMMSAYYPEFSLIDEGAVYSWLLELEAALQGRNMTHSEKWSRVYRIQEQRMPNMAQPDNVNHTNDNVTNTKIAPQISVNVLPIPPPAAQAPASSAANTDQSAPYYRDQNGYNNKVLYGNSNGSSNERSYEEDKGILNWRARTDTDGAGNELSYRYNNGMPLVHAPQNIVQKSEIHANKEDISNAVTYSYQNVVDATPYGYTTMTDGNNDVYGHNNRLANGRNYQDKGGSSKGAYNHNNGMANGTEAHYNGQNGISTGRQYRYNNGTANVQNLRSYGYSKNMSNGKNDTSSDFNNGMTKSGYTMGTSKGDRIGKGYGYNNGGNYVSKNEERANNDCSQSNGDIYGRTNKDSYSKFNGDNYINVGGDSYGQTNGDSYNNFGRDSCSRKNSDSYGKGNGLRYERFNQDSNDHLRDDSYERAREDSYGKSIKGSYLKGSENLYHNSGYNYGKSSGDSYGHISEKSYERANGDKYGKSYEAKYVKDSGDSYAKDFGHNYGGDSGESYSKDIGESFGKADEGSHVDYHETSNIDRYEEPNIENNEEISTENDEVNYEMCEVSSEGKNDVAKTKKQTANEEKNVFCKENKATVKEDKKDTCNGGVAEKKEISLLSLVDMLPKPTRESKNIDIWEGTAGAGAPRKSRRNKHSSSSESESLQDHHMDKFSFHKQCEQLRDIFPQTCELELKHCLTITNGDVEQATLTLLNRQEIGVSLATAAAAIAAAPPKPKINDDEIKKRVIARYSFVDKNAETKEHRPVAPKNEPKKLVRYRDNKIVSLKGERYTEVSKSGHDDDQPRKPKKPHCP